ncbi:MAG TPA: hypothetical protein VN039_13430 [Nitrospira sp.]|nr:hypothetical protein [Nitrospira sp.]
MPSHPSSRGKNLESSIELNLLAGILVLCALLLALFADGGAISRRTPEFSPRLMINQWWLEFVKLIRMIFALTFAGAISVGSFPPTVALGKRFRRVWWWLHHR